MDHAPCTEYLVDAMDNIPALDDLFDPAKVSPINDTLAAMMDYAVTDGSYPGVVIAAESLINDLAREMFNSPVSHLNLLFSVAIWQFP